MRLSKRSATHYNKHNKRNLHTKATQRVASVPMFRNLSITSKHLSINTHLFMTSKVLISSRLFSTTSIRRMDNDNNDISETSKTEKLNSSSNLAEEYNKRRENTKILYSEFTVQSHKLRALATRYKNLSDENLLLR